MNRIYFDNAATTPVDTEVIAAMTTVLTENFGNPSSIHADGRRARTAVEESRRMVAKSIGASIGEVFFTSCGTESNNMALKNAVRDLGVRRIISARTEHHCVLHSLDFLTNTANVEIRYLAVDRHGRIDPDELERQLSSNDTRTLVSLMHANNEIGTMIDLDEIASICSKYHALFHTDTVQTIGYFPIDVSKTPISFLSGSAHKLYGPKGCGFIYINSENMVKPFIDGGSQERNMRAGTENVAGIVGLAKAVELATNELSKRRETINRLRNYFKQQLIEGLEDVQFNGDESGLHHYKILSVSFPQTTKSDLLLLNLDIEGISASGGSACSSGVDVGSHVLQAIRAAEDRVTIRFSFSHHNTANEVDFVVDKLRNILRKETVQYTS